MKSSFDKKVRNVVVKRGLLPEPKAKEAEEISNKEDKSFSDVLIEHGFVSEPDLISTIALEMNIPPIDVEKVEPDEKARGTLDQNLATYYGVLPIARVGKLLTLAVANPFDILKLDDIRVVTECEIRPVVSTERSIRKVIQKVYANGEQEMRDLIDKTSAPEVELTQEPEEEDDADISKLTEASGDSPVIKLVNMILSQALRDGASDIHIEPFEKAIRVRYRQDGVLRATFAPPKKMLGAIVSRIKIMASLDIAERRIPQDGKFKMNQEGRQVDFRVSILPSVHGEKVVMRILDSSAAARRLDQLGFEPQSLDAMRRGCAASYGMLLITGPTGSGKSTTLYSMIQEVKSDEDNIVTVEDPVEYQMDGVIQVPVSTKRGLTFASALRSILRQDPDTIMIGEIRDFETADIAVKAAITGHLVLSTLHTNDAASSISRLLDMGIDPFMVASSTVLVAAQRLARRLCDHCKQPVQVPPDRLAAVGFSPQEARGGTIYRAVGCGRCANGYKGRFALLEVMELDEELRRMILNGASALDFKEYSIKKRGMISLRRCGVLNALRGVTSVEEVLRNTMND
ncbi:MAG: Flp pilus assembly complex ATPase component TadA [Planctomycetes bacterium]|nr:Flp pilus assembly complex ATPase component TadA [Planctomycetota bacterium]